MRTRGGLSSRRALGVLNIRADARLDRRRLNVPFHVPARAILCSLVMRASPHVYLVAEDHLPTRLGAHSGPAIAAWRYAEAIAPRPNHRSLACLAAAFSVCASGEVRATNERGFVRFSHPIDQVALSAHWAVYRERVQLFGGGLELFKFQRVFAVNQLSHEG